MNKKFSPFKADDYIDSEALRKEYLKELLKNSEKTRINISLPKSLLKAIDEVSSNRSEFFTNLAFKALN